MALDLRLQVKLSQQLVMTPQLQQAIKLLQLSRMELLDVVTEELAENPMLEESEELVAPEAQVEEKPAGEESTEEAKNESEAVDDIDWQTYLEGYSLSSTTTSDVYEDNEDRPSFESLLTKKSTLFDHLMWQLNLSIVPETEHLAAAEIIGNIDDAGYLHATLDDICTATSVDQGIAEQALTRIQQFDPAGVAGRNLQECLLLQLERLGLEESLSDL